MNAFLQLSGLHGNSSDPYHIGWIELARLDLGPDRTARRRRGSPTDWVPPLILQCAAVSGPHSLDLHVANDTGRPFASATLDVVGRPMGPSVAATRIQMSQVRVTSYQLVRDPGLKKSYANFTLVTDEYRFERGVALELNFVHEALHAS